VARIGWRVLTTLAGCGFSVGSQRTDASIDAPVDGSIDTPADAFTLDSCGAAYIITHGQSRYRIVAQPLTAWAASSSCAADRSNATHLVVVDNLTEQLQIQNDVNTTPNGTNAFWVGAVQRFDAMQITAGWLSLTGGPFAGTWSSVEPTDNDGGPPYDTEVHAEQFVRFDRNGQGLVDAPGLSAGHGYICECDGKPIDPVAAQAIVDSTGI
jgi:hypothetical protein